MHCTQGRCEKTCDEFVHFEDLLLLPDLERFYKSSITDSVAADIWLTDTTKKSYAYVSVIDGLIILNQKDPSHSLLLLISIPISNHYIDDKSCVLCHKNLESVLL